jgi:ribonuclease D
MDLAPLFALLANPRVLKVFHAARQDIEIFYRLTGAVPAPLFDTQLAAMVCGYGEEVGYETLVGRIAKGLVDKSSRFTDWSRRPLSAQADLRARRREPSAGDLRRLKRRAPSRPAAPDGSPRAR